MLTPHTTAKISAAANAMVADVDAWLDRAYENTDLPGPLPHTGDRLCDHCALLTEQARHISPDDQPTTALLANMAALLADYQHQAKKYPLPHVGRG